MYIRLRKEVKIIKSYMGALVINSSDKGVEIFDVNSSGLEILLLCDGTRTGDKIIDIIRNMYNIDDENILCSIKSFLEEYLQKEILEYCENNEKIIVNEKGDENLIIPISLSLEVTNSCQLRCIHCFNSSGIMRDNELTVDEFINIAQQFSELGTQTIFLTGGEPFIKKDINKLIDFVAREFSTVNIASNAYMLSEKTIELIAKHKNISIQVSIDSIENTHDKIRGVLGAYSRTIKNIKKLCELKIPVTISFTMNDINVDELEVVIKKAKEIGCIGVNIGLTSNSGRAKQNNIPTKIAKDFVSKLVESYNKFSTPDFFVGLDICETKIRDFFESIEYANKCGAGYNVIHIFADGKVSMCPAIKKIILGNVRNQSISEILQYNNIERVMNIPTPTKGICGDCEQYNMCGNCIASMLEKSSEECVVVRDLQL
ncbi:PqqD family peptide modification chaperone [Thermoanaerobacterium thermosaccharolyticum]|uniref:PqqD family peptide modification chaperone n=1 Tax=Thermoanaerobacterium thermosaccharolyticum TaxID=1517 RepID=UPI003D2768C3